MDYYRYLRPALFTLPAEMAHRAAVLALKHGVLPSAHTAPDARLQVETLGLYFPNPIGLAAGFDKNGEAYNALFTQGFGFVEVGTITPRPQPGNARPRLFRLKEDEAVINRFGFNSGGLAALEANRTRQGAPRGILGVNIGKNKDSTDAVEDYVTMLRAASAWASYITVNISSPNTQGLRDLQRREPLEALLRALSEARLSNGPPLLVKIAPDMDTASREDIAELALRYRIDGLIISNTTIARPEGLKSAHAGEQGGLSGGPLLAISTHALREMHKLTKGAIPLIGVGGIASAEDAYEKIRSGATLVQLYSALVYQGFGLVTRIQRELPEMLLRDGFKSIKEAIGIYNK